MMSNEKSLVGMFWNTSSGMVQREHEENRAGRGTFVYFDKKIEMGKSFGSAKILIKSCHMSPI